MNRDRSYSKITARRKDRAREAKNRGMGWKARKRQDPTLLQREKMREGGRRR